MKILIGIILTLLLAGGLGWWLSRLRSRARHLLTTPDTLAQYRNLHTGAADPGSGIEWTDCPCCASPTLDTRSAYPVCQVCDWEHGLSASAGVLQQARRNFQAYGTVDAPEELDQWSGTLPGESEIAARRAVVAASEEAREGEIDLGTAWAMISEYLPVLHAERESRIQGAQDQARGP